MAKLRNILLDADVLGHRVRYFEPPQFLEKGEADFPWVAFEDLTGIFSDGSDFTNFIFQKLREDWPDPVTVATIDGIVTIVPRYMAEGLFDAVEENSSAYSFDEGLDRLRGRYRNQLTAAMKAMTQHLSPAEKLAFSLEAFAKD